MSQKLTKTVVDRAAVEAKRYILWDRELKGFGLLVLPSGVKSYLYNYRTPEGARRRITIGKHGDWTAAEARKKAEDYRDAVKQGLDPLGQQQALRQSITIGELLDTYLESAKFKEKADSTQATDRGRINRHLKPLLGKVYLHRLRPEDVRRAFKQITDGKTATKAKTGARGLARVTGGEGTARKAVRLLRACLQWAMDEGIADLPKNPCDGVEVGSDGTRDIVLTDQADYKRLFQTLDDMEEKRELRQATADAIRVIALTGARRSEVAELKWQHVDLDRGCIVLPPKGHKTGRRTGKPRIIGLPSLAVEIIKRQPEGEPGDFVFQPAKGTGSINLSKPWRTIRDRAGLPEGIGLHGLRHSLATQMAMAGAQAAEIMAALGHRQLSTAQRYIHWAEDQQQALAERAASMVTAAASAAQAKPKIQKKRITRKSL